MKDHDQPLDDSTILQLCLERDRLLSDTEFARSPSMCKLLRFLVDYKLSGNSVPLKSYAIATDALGRHEDFDTQTDSYPRVQMGRLRRMLDNFYLRKGGENRLAIARNKYEILLEPNVAPSEKEADLIGESAEMASPEEPAARLPESELPPQPDLANDLRSHRRFVSFLGLAILLSLSIILGYLLWPTEDAPQDVDQIGYPAVALDLPGKDSGAPTDEIIQSIGNRLIRSLNGFGGMRIYDIRSSQQGNAGYVIRLRYLNPAAEEIELRLLDRVSGEILWSREIITTDKAVWQLEIDKAVVALAGHYGEVAQAEMSKIGSDDAIGYPCLLRFDVYIRYREQEKLGPVRKCLQESVARFPDDAHLLSILAFAQNMSESGNPDSQVKGVGMLLARKAEALDQRNAAANFAIAQSAFFAGDCATGVAWGEKAVALNPLNSRISGYLGLYMIGCNMPEGENYATRALELDPNADLTIAAAVAFQMLKRGEAEQARQLSSLYMASSPRVEPALELTYIISSAMLGEKREARQVWKSLAERYGFSEASSPREVLSQWIGSPTLREEIIRVMGRSGIFDN